MTQRQKYKEQARKYIEAHYRKLVGKTVRNVVRDGGNPEFWGLEFTDGTIAFISQDAEGNGPGWLDIQQAEEK